MKQIPVTSQLIKSIFFSPEDGSLWIKMQNGENRLFTGVPEEVVTEMAEAPSPGNYYIRRIRASYPRLAA